MKKISTILLFIFIFCSGCRLPKKQITLIQIQPAIGKESSYVQGVKLEGATRSILYRRIGTPISSKSNPDEPSNIDQSELLDNAFVWIKFGQKNINDRKEQEVPTIAVFDFDDVADTYNRQLRLTWKYKGKTYLLDETVTPRSLKAHYPDAVENKPPYKTDPRGTGFSVCDASVIVTFWDSRIIRVGLAIRR